MGSRLLATLLAAALTAGCDPCGDLPTIRGQIKGEEVAWCGAYYGVDLWLGSHAEQLSGAPVSHTLWLMLTREPEPCEVLDIDDMISGAIVTHVPPATGPLERSGFGVDLGGERVLDVDFDLVVTGDSVAGLPERHDDGPPFLQVSGIVAGDAALTFVTDPPYPEKSETVGHADGAFRAGHCPGMDLVTLE